MNINQELEKHLLNEHVMAQGKSSIKPDEDLLTQGIIDSLGLLKLVAFMENNFHISIPEEELIPENFGTIESLSNLITKFSPNIAKS